MSFYIAAGDTEPGIIFDCVDDDGLATALDDVVEFHLRWFRPDGTSAAVALSISNLATGSFVRRWVVGDTSLVGVHTAQVVVIRGSGGQEHFPRDGTFFYWTVTARL